MRIAPFVAALLLATTSPALAAGTVSRFSESSAVDYDTAGPADVVVTDAPAGSGVALTISETGIQPGATFVGCVDNGNSITCTYPDPEDARLSTSLSAMSDVLDAGAVSLSTISVQDVSGGDDTITGGRLAFRLDNGLPTGDNLFAGPGMDQVFGGDGNDQLGAGLDGGGLVDAGSGDDTVVGIGGPGPPDALHGGPGKDELYMRQDADPLDPPQSFSIDLATGTVTDLAGLDAPDAVDGFEDAQTDDGDDVMVGTDGPNEFRSGAGNDRIDGRLGSDLFFTFTGDDRLDARDGMADRLDAGPGGDICVVDQLDESAECETLDPANVPPFGAVFPDLDAPGCRFPGLTRKQRARRVARRGVVVTADCDEPGRVSARLTGRLRRLDGRTRLARAGELELASRSARLGAGDRAQLRLKVGRRLRRLLRRGARLRLEVSAIDTAGNRARPLVRRLRLR